MTPTTAQDFSQLLQRYLTEAKGHITKMAVFAFVLCLLPLMPLLAKGELLWLLILPIGVASFVGRGLQSVLDIKHRAAAVMQSEAPVKMFVTDISKQFLFWNSVSSPGYKLDLAPLNSVAATIQKLKVDPASKAGVEKMAALQAQFDQAKETSAATPTAEVDVYFDEKQLPVALVISGELVWAVYWW